MLARCSRPLDPAACRLHSMRSADGLSSGLGHAEMLNLTLTDEFPQRAHDIFHRRIRINAVLIEQIELGLLRQPDGLRAPTLPPG